jgi:hypothetical protein
MYQHNSNNQIATIHLNSKLATTRGETTYFNLTTPITCPINQQIVISVAEFYIPNVFPNVNNSNNTLVITYYETPIIFNDYTIILPIKYWSPKAFTEYINQQLIGLGVNINIFYNKTLFKMEFSSTNNFTISTGTTCGALLGLNKNANNEWILPLNAQLAPTYHLYPPSTINFKATDTIFIKNTDFTLQNINSFGTINNTICRVPVNSNYGESIYYRPTELDRFIVYKKSLNVFGLTLTDDVGNLLDFGGQDFNLLLKIEYMYPISSDVEEDKGTIPYFIKNKLYLPSDPVDEDDVLGN